MTPHANPAWIKVDKIKFVWAPSLHGTPTTVISMVGEHDDDSWIVRESVDEIMLMIAVVGRAP